MYDEKSHAKAIAISIFSGIVILLGLITLFSSMRSISTGEIGVVTQYGKVTGRELTEGFSWVAPWGVNSVTSYSIKTQKEEQNATAATNDLQDVTGTLVVNYHINRGSVSELHKTVGKDYVSVLITPALQEVFKSSTAKFDALQLINSRDKVKDEVVVGLRKRLEPRGISVEDISIVNLEFSKEFSKAIEQRQVAQQNAERAKYNLEQARLDAQSQDVQAKTLTKEYLQLKAIEKWDGHMPKAMGGSGSLFNIPIK